uniref:Hexosyltransferase n=1 Tax=Haemonchus placei TaxID=6290 RepID=A0A0N4VV36_HAEPC
MPITNLDFDPMKIDMFLKMLGNTFEPLKVGVHAMYLESSDFVACRPSVVRTIRGTDVQFHEAHRYDCSKAKIWYAMVSSAVLIRQYRIQREVEPCVISKNLYSYWRDNTAVEMPTIHCPL